VLRAGNDPVNALEYYESYLAIRDSLQLAQKLRQQKLEQRISRLERSENDLLLRLQQESLSELAINRLTLQLEREEQARELLEKENDLRSLEEERLRQSLVITEQQHRVEQQERQNRILEQEQRIARLALEQEQRKQREAEQEIRLLEQQQRLDQLSMEKQKQQRKALIGIVGLMILVVILVTGSLLLTRKKNMLLARQKNEIEEKNRDLEQMNEEISAQRDEIEAQRDMLFEQKEAIEQYNVEITKSIEYAKRIQSSTLPDLGLLREVVSDYFLVFRPRDIVSGDFYWMARMEDSTVVAVADCTGHGVPGAFMSVLGMSLLKEIVQKEYLTHPGVILRRMRKEIIRSLGQKGISGEQRDGMDISLIEISNGEKQVRYAGAFNSLYLVRKRGMKTPEIKEMKVMDGENNFILYELPADRMPVAFFDRMDKYTTHGFSIEEGDRIYMYTDGYADQFGGEKGKKFKYKPFKKLILDSAGLPMEEQGTVLSQNLDEWQGDFDQIDDICMIGLKF
jgi:serine phosphatase RsbU (regulator of sigma subunit)